MDVKTTIYAVADLHGRRDAVRSVRENVARHRPDVIVVAGDITGLFRPSATVEALAGLDMPVLAVRGNSDLRRVDRLVDAMPGCRSLHGRAETVAGVRFVGIGGTIPVPFHSRIDWRERALLDRMRPLVDSRAVLVTHTPPRGVRDEVGGGIPAGSRALREFILDRQPRLNICGHIHERAGTAMLGKTLVVNCAVFREFRGALIRISEDAPPEVDICFEMAG